MRANAVKVLVVDDNEKTRDGLIEQLRFADVEVVGESIFGAAAYTWAEQLDVDIVIVSIEEPVARSLRTVESLAIGARTWPVIGLSTRPDRETMRKAMVAGVRDFLPAPVPSEELRRTIINLHHVEQTRRAALAQGEAVRRLGTIVTVFGVKGGIGKSTLASNMAVALAQQTQQHVAMLDLDLQFGDAAVMLDVLPSQTIEHAAKELTRMDPQLMQSYLIDHPSRVKLLAAPATPDGSEGITGEQVGPILEGLASTNDYVIVDTSAQLDEVTMMALDLATLVLLVIVPEVPCVRRTRACLTLMQEWGYTQDKVKLVVNRAQNKAPVSIAEIEDVLQYPIYAQIPDDRAIIKGISLGTPVSMSAPKSRSGKAINELGRVLAGLPKRQRRFGLPKRNPAPKPSQNSRLLAPVPAHAPTSVPHAYASRSYPTPPGDPWGIEQESYWQAEHHAPAPARPQTTTQTSSARVADPADWGLGTGFVQWTNPMGIGNIGQYSHENGTTDIRREEPLGVLAGTAHPDETRE